VHKIKYECDFLVRSGYKISAAIQVCLSLQDAKTKQREINGLLEALDTYQLDQGLIITEEEADSFEQEYKSKIFKIEVTPCWQWLLKE